MYKFYPWKILAIVILGIPTAYAQSPSGDNNTTSGKTLLPGVTVSTSADASAEGLSPPYAGGQVARGGRAGILGTNDNMDTPFSITSYTNELIQDRQARSVGDVLQNDPSVRVARGFGNFQESYFIRGFVLSSDDVAFNGLFSLLPRQYIATELFERVEVMRGASAFLTGANPGGGGIGGAINLLPKRAPNEPLTRLTTHVGSGWHHNVGVDVARRFGPDQKIGVRFNGAYRGGGAAVDKEGVQLGLAAVGLDWRGDKLRLSADIGWQDNRLKRTRTNVTLGSGIVGSPRLPDPTTNFAQPWSYSNENDIFGTLRGEYDINSYLTAWAAYGLRRTDEKNSLANFTLDNRDTGDGYATRFDNARKDNVDTGEIGIRGKFSTGPIDHRVVISGSYFENERKNAYAWDFFNQLNTNMFSPVSWEKPDFSSGAFRGNNLSSPGLTGRTRLLSFAVGDTVSILEDMILLTVGFRHQNLRIESYAYDTEAKSPTYDRNRISPSVSAVYKINKQFSIYGNYIEGLTQGDTAPGMAINSGQVLAPYVSKQKEIGAKYDGGRIGATIALFTTTKPRSIINADNVFTSSGRDRHRGIELGIYGEVIRGLRLLGGATWLDAKQRSTGDVTTDSQRVIGVPSFQASMGADWDIPGLQGVTFDSRVVHTGSSYANDVNTVKVAGWTRLDLGLRYLTEFRGHLITFRGRVDNVTNRKHWASVGGYPGQGYLVAGMPRTFVISASIDY